MGSLAVSAKEARIALKVSEETRMNVLKRKWLRRVLIVGCGNILYCREQSSTVYCGQAADGLLALISVFKFAVILTRAHARQCYGPIDGT